MKLRTKFLLFVEGGVAAGILILSVAMYGMAAAELEDQAGMRTSPLPLRIRIAVELSGDRLRIRVQNTGQWVGEAVDPTSPHLHVGMENLRGRLKIFYGDAWRMAVDTSGGWITVALDLPIMEQSPA